MEAAKGWAAPNLVENQTITEMEENGAPQHIIDELKHSNVVEILPINWPVVIWFNDVCDLMRFKPEGACLGLDLLQIRAESEMSERKYSTSQFKGLRIMSKVAANTLNQRAK